MPTEIALIQVAAYVTLTLASIIVASVSLTIAYRQNFGWKPLALVTSHGLENALQEPLSSMSHWGAMLKFEVWNRRKYPIAVRHITVKFSVLKFDERVKAWPYDRTWHISGRTLSYRDNYSLDPSGHMVHKIVAPFAVRSLDDILDPIVIEVRYYDPRTNKSKIISIKHVYHIGALDKRRTEKRRWLQRLGAKLKSA